MWLFRSTTVRLAYLSGDQPDITFVAKELARQSKEPRQVDVLGVNRLARYPIGSPWQVLVMRRQRRPDILVAYTDTGHAGCVVSRKSMPSYALFWGRHWMRTGSGAQKLVATSSAEAEFYAGTRGASVLLGATRLMLDLGVPLTAPLLYMDTTGRLGIAGRRGFGTVKPLATAALRLQAAFSSWPRWAWRGTWPMGARRRSPGRRFTATWRPWVRAPRRALRRRARERA